MLEHLKRFMESETAHDPTLLHKFKCSVFRLGIYESSDGDIFSLDWDKMTDEKKEALLEKWSQEAGADYAELRANRALDPDMDFTDDDAELDFGTKVGELHIDPITGESEI